MTVLISFDIDGTLEIGDPPGIITMTMVRRARELGYFIGSCSDRTLTMQQLSWESQNIAVDFMVLKQNLDDVKAQFEASSYYHIGDTDIDAHYAERSGFHFVWATAEAISASAAEFSTVFTGL